MAKIEDNINSFWLFPDNVVKDHEYVFMSYEPAYKTRNGNEVPVFCMVGKMKMPDGKISEESELLVSRWKIKNLKELKQKLGEDSKSWLNYMFKIEVDSQQRFILTPRVTPV